MSNSLYQPIQPSNILQYCPSCCRSYRIILHPKYQCKCCQRYFCSNCLDQRNRFCHICVKHTTTKRTCLGVLSTHFIDGNEITKIKAFTEFLKYWSESVYNIEDLIKGGMIPGICYMLKYNHYHQTIIDIIVLALKKDIKVRNMIDSVAFVEMGKIREHSRKIMFILGCIVVSSMKGCQEGEFQTLSEIIQRFESAHEFVKKRITN